MASAAPTSCAMRPRLAEMVAGALRDRILSGELADGAMLPKQDELLEEFGVSLPPIREALRILETEGLITVQRGNVGGAVVHRPQAYKAAYMLGLRARSRATAPLGDVLVDRSPPSSRRASRPCAARPTATRRAARAAGHARRGECGLDDADAYTGLARQFHIDLVAAVRQRGDARSSGALEALWTAHVDQLARRRRRARVVLRAGRARGERPRARADLHARSRRATPGGGRAGGRAPTLGTAEPGWGESIDHRAVVAAELLDGNGW